ncbi:hypothetical protein N5B55_04990 [Ralstonia pickettii]|uniref:hypothetical protein n=1 Tax=Ralstonia pickettii TaxID=329 RepID=UPI0027155710|nr:hypothetical protein [Ralstonia pickettii]WKZ86310.1 hypothetical protein N5B55_04990 [Ralstonia pickettii]
MAMEQLIERMKAHGFREEGDLIRHDGPLVPDYPSWTAAILGCIDVAAEDILPLEEEN